MHLIRLLLVILLAIPNVLAEGLPELGDAAQVSLSPLQERRLGDSIMREARADPSYYDDAEMTEYINSLGNRLVTRGTDTPQSLDFFLMRDKEVNAFALPGGHIGVNTGLILTAQSESELAAVVAHEIGHIVQHHMARMVAQQSRSQITSLAALAVAILAARANSDVAQAAVAFGQAGVIQNQLNFTRANEQEADRVGLQILERSGFDPRGMVTFFERLQRTVRFSEGNAPSYLRTHPLTYERIADIQNRVESLPYRQVPDSLEFQLIRAKIKASSDTPREATEFFEASLKERKFLSEAASHYGLVTSLIRARDYVRADKEFAILRKLGGASPMIDSLGCQLRNSAGQTDAALACYREALKAYPDHRALLYDYADALLQNRRAQTALQLVENRMQYGTDDYRLYLLQARSYAMLNKRLAQHRAQGEAYARMGNVSAAVEQLQLAVKSGDGDFYQLSSAEARLRELRKLDNELRKEQGKDQKR